MRSLKMIDLAGEGAKDPSSPKPNLN